MTTTHLRAIIFDYRGKAHDSHTGQGVDCGTYGTGDNSFEVLRDWIEELEKTPDVPKPRHPEWDFEPMYQRASPLFTVLVGKYTVTFRLSDENEEDAWNPPPEPEEPEEPVDDLVDEDISG